MYKLTDRMLQALEKDLRKFHELFQGGRCQAWQLAYYGTSPKDMVTMLASIGYVGILSKERFTQIFN